MFNDLSPMCTLRRPAQQASRITVAITTDPTKASALHVHASTLKSLDHMESQDMYVGMPVFAQWGNEFYDGAIVAKFVKGSDAFVRFDLLLMVR